MISRNPLLAGARGGLGKVVVLKQMYGRTVMTNYPKRVAVPRELQSAAQRATRDRFREAAVNAKHILKDPVRKAYYEKKKKQMGLYSAYQAAIADYMRKPQLESVNRQKYTGALGGRIVMTVRKPDFGAREVTVTLVSQQSGVIIEQGAAIKHSNGSWVYTASRAVADAADVRVMAMARGPGLRWDAL